MFRDVGLRENFSGTTEIASGEIDEDVERYLTDSEQIESALACDATVAETRIGRVIGSAGILVQALPGEASIEVALSRGLFADGALARVVAAGLPPTGDDLLRAVFTGRLVRSACSTAGRRASSARARARAPVNRWRCSATWTCRR